MAALPEAIARIREKFDSHLKSGKLSGFSPDAADNQQLSELTRRLVTKKQTGELTQEEALALLGVDRLAEDIAKFNSRDKTPDARGGLNGQENIYDLLGGRLREAQASEAPVAIAKVSAADADRIIKGLNEQFVEKVLKKLQDGAEIQGQPSWKARDFSLPVQATAEGQNLHDYLEKLRVELPDRPFTDPDSQRDLSRVKVKVN